MKKIAIDIDDTITDTSGILFAYIEESGIIDLTNPVNNKLDIMRGKITCPELLDFYREYAPILAENVNVKEGVKEGLKFLRQAGFEIHIVSSRIPETYDSTVTFFTKNELPYDFLIVSIYDKKEYCKQHGINFLIDDAIETCEAVKNSGTVPILFTTLLNEEIETDVVRLSSWNDIQGNEIFVL